jgi:hypothetical protein
VKKTLKTRNDFAVKTNNILKALTEQKVFKDGKANAEVRRFFLKSTSTRLATLFIMAKYFEKEHITASDVYNTLHPSFGSKSSFVNFINLGVKKGHFKMTVCKNDLRKKYLAPCCKFTQIWCEFISISEGVPIADNIDWKKVTCNFGDEICTCDCCDN